MALGLENMKSFFNTKKNDVRGVTLKQLLDNNEGFPMNYLPSYRKINGQDFIKTSMSGNDVNNMPVFYKWLFINSSDLSATADSTSEYARIPESGYIMRIMQRSLLPYHENFVIDYFENINSINVITLDQDTRSQFSYKQNGAYRTFRMGDSAVPQTLKSEIFSYPEIFFKAYIEEAIPHNLIYNGNDGPSSNHISAYGGSYSNNNENTAPIDMSIMSHGLKTPQYNPYLNKRGGSQPNTRVKAPNDGRVYYPRGTSMNTKSVQERINQQVSAQHNLYGGPTKGYTQSQNNGNKTRLKSISETGLRYQI